MPDISMLPFVVALIPRLDLGTCMKPVHVATAQVRTVQHGSLRQEASDCCEA
jgi:hypothetical protein